MEKEIANHYRINPEYLKEAECPPFWLSSVSDVVNYLHNNIKKALPPGSAFSLLLSLSLRFLSSVFRLATVFTRLSRSSRPT